MGLNCSACLSREDSKLEPADAKPVLARRPPSSHRQVSLPLPCCAEDYAMWHVSREQGPFHRQGQDASGKEATTEAIGNGVDAKKKSRALSEIVAEFPPPSRRRAATEWLASDSSEPEAEDDISDGDNSTWANKTSQEWDADWSTISSDLQPQKYKISTPRAWSPRRIRARRAQRRVVRFLGEQAVDDQVEVNSECGARRTRARAVSDGLPARRRSAGGLGLRLRVRTEGVYRLDWANIAPMEA